MENATKALLIAAGVLLSLIIISSLLFGVRNIRKIKQEEANKIIRNYINANDITKSGIDKYIREYPDSTFRNYYELKLDNVLA